MPTIKLTQGKETFVSEEDFEHLAKRKWHIHGKKHQCAAGSDYSTGKLKIILMHRIIIERMTGEAVPSGYEVDHIDGNPLNNRRENLRLVTRSQNNMNNRSHRGSTSQYKGVCWEKRDKKWRSYINKDGERTELGLFKDEKEAARAYDRAARELFGEYARPNFPD